jgi:type IV secretory pathway VirJ component
MAFCGRAGVGADRRRLEGDPAPRENGRLIAAFVLALASSAAAVPASAVSSPAPSAQSATKADALQEWTVRVPFVGQAHLYSPPHRVDRAVLFLSGDGGWKLGVVDMARRASRVADAVVAGVSLPAYLKAALTERVPCWCPACDLEEIGKAVEKQVGFREPTPPILLGYSSGATLVYAALAGGPPETFSGGMSLGFCPDLEGAPAPCRHKGWLPAYDAEKKRADFPPVDLETAWVVLQGRSDKVCGASDMEQFAHSVKGARVMVLDNVGHGYGNEKRWGPAFDEGLKMVVKAHAAAVAAEEERNAKGGPMTVVDAGENAPGEATFGEASGGEGSGGEGSGGEASGGASHSPANAAADQTRQALLKLDLPLEIRLVDVPRAYFIFISGDGGWSRLDKTLVEELARKGVATIGINALKYFWTVKTPGQVAADVKRVAVALQPGGKPLLFGGYSFGAEVAPFVYGRPELQGVDFQALLSIAPGLFATWEMSPLDWVRPHEKASPDHVKQRLESLDKVPVLCVYGTSDDESACIGMKSTDKRRVEALGGGHHFGGDYDVIADAVGDFVVKVLDRRVLSSPPSSTSGGEKP